MSSVPLHPNTQTAQLPCKCKVSLTPDGVFQLTSPTGATFSLNLPSDPDHPHGVESQDLPVHITARLAKLDSASVFEVQAQSACGALYRGSALLTNLASHDPLDAVHLTSQQQPQLPSFVGIIRHGSGHQTSSVGDTYEGQWQHDLRSGTAVFRSVLHDYVYQGQYAADQWHGQGTLEFKQSGTKYVGQFLHDRMAGPGVLTSADGTVYNGQFWDGCCHGTGRADYGEGHFYEGEWIQGLREGEGTCRFPNGLTYTGNWVDNKPHASHFKLSLDTGETLQVDSKMGTVEIQEGRLVLCAAQTQPKKIMLGDATYKGTWLAWVNLGTGLFADPQLDLPACLHVLDQKRHPATVEVEFGSSVATQPDQLVCRVPVTVHRPEAEVKEAVEVASGTVSLKYRVLASKAGGTGVSGVDGRFGFHGKGELERGGVSLYKGQWLMGQMHGHGEMQLLAGKFEGDLVNGRLHGTGNLQQNNQRLYFGDFKNNLRTGHATLCFPDGDIFEGNFVEGELCGKGKLISAAHGKTMYGLWIGGSCVEHHDESGNRVWTIEDVPDGEGTVEFDVAKVTANWLNKKIAPKTNAYIAYDDTKVYRGQMGTLYPQDYGRFEFPSGNMAEGVMFNGKLEGMGINFRSQTLDWIFGNHKAGEFHGKITKLLPDGMRCIEQHFENGKAKSERSERAQTEEDWLKIRSRFPDLPGRKLYRAGRDAEINTDPLPGFDPYVPSPPGVALTAKPPSTSQSQPQSQLQSQPKPPLQPAPKLAPTPLRPSLPPVPQSSSLSTPVTVPQPPPVPMTHTSDPSTQLSGGFSFRGPLSADGLPHGVGTLTGPFGYVYVGEVQAGLPHGRGKETVPWGHTFEGQFEQGLRKIVGGSRVWLLNKASGVIQIKGDKQEPILQHLTLSRKQPADGITLIEPSGKHHKNLEKVLYNGGATYTGKLNPSNGKRHGYGSFETSEGYKYEGNWENDLEHGDGTATYPDGFLYEGQFRKGMRQGKGILMSIKCPDHKYEGGFEMDLPHGQGEFHYKNGHRYTGGFYQGLFLGYGVYYVPKSHVFSGHFLFGDKNGVGECIYSNGLKFKGNYDNDKRHRYGRFVTADGEITCGFWNRGRRQHQMLEIKKESSIPNREDLDYDDFLIGNPASLSKLQANMAKISSIIADRILRQKDPEFRVYVSEFDTGRKLKNTSKELSFDATFQKFCEQWTDKTSRNIKSPTAVAERPRHNGSFISDYAASQTVLSEDEVVHNQERSVYAPMEHANDLEIQREPVMGVTQNPFAEEADSSSKSMSGRQKTQSAPLEDLQNNGSECS